LASNTRSSSPPERTVFTGQNIGADASDSDADTTTGKTQIVTLASGEHNPTLDAGVYAKASLGNYVWVDGNNDGQQGNGADIGLNGVTVNLYKGDGTLVATTTTANNGGNPGYYCSATWFRRLQGRVHQAGRLRLRPTGPGR